MKNILLLEDEGSLNKGIRLKLEREGYHVEAGASLKEGYKIFRDQPVDLVICDVGLEDGSGLDFCQTIRKTSNVLFLFLTALDTELDIVTGYDMGADDYITKPFSLQVLLSKVKALLRRGENSGAERIRSGDLVCIPQELKLYKDRREIALSKNEWRLLSLFLENPKLILSKKQMLESLWDANEDYVDENTVAVNISRLRKKIEDNPVNPEYIKNVRGIGYLWDKDCVKE